MMSIRHIFLILVLVNSLFLAITYYNVSQLPANPSTKQLSTNRLRAEEIEPLYSFKDPAKAYYLLSLLDTGSVIRTNRDDEFYRNSPFYGLKLNEDYCDHHRALITSQPDLIFKQANLVSNLWQGHQVRTSALTRVQGKDLHPEIHKAMSERRKNSSDIELSPEANMFFIAEPMHYKRQPGKHFACLSQTYNHIPGHDMICRKDSVGNGLTEYSKKYLDRPNCFNFDKLFPRTWLLMKEDQCKEFFEEFTSPKYEEMKKKHGVVYFRKISTGVHKGEGVFPVGEQEEKNIAALYGNGSLCGKVQDNNLIQAAVQNSLLVHGHKFHFRVYLFVASTNPLIAYYHDGYMRLSVNKFDPESNDIDTFVTNRGITQTSSGEGRKDSPFKNMTEAEIKEATCWFYPQLQEYLMEEGMISDPNWLDNHLRRQFKKTMVHLLRMSSGKFAKQSALNELYGLDFMMDNNLDVWFIEANPMPLIWGWSGRTVGFFNRLLRSDFEIVVGLMRSRMKRVVAYVNMLITETRGFDFEGGDVLPDLEKRRKEFQNVVKNRFEPEFMPGVNNTFQLIVDENLKGTARYMGLLEKECM